MSTPLQEVSAPRQRVGTALLVLATLWHLVLATRSYAHLSYQVLAADDAFYYFKIVRNVVRLGWSTFDGLHATSGVQLLWSIVLLPFAWAVDDRMVFVRVVMGLCAAINLATGLLLRRLATRLHSPLVGECAAATWAVVMMVWLTPTLTGMEYPLHALVAVGSLLVWWPIVERPDAVTGARVAALAALLTLNFWTRLDSLYYSAALGAVAAWRLWPHGPASRRVRDLAWLTGLPAAGALAYAGVCYAMAGTFTPISGVVKGLYATQYFAGHPAATIWRERVEWWMQIQAQPVVDLLATPVGVAAWETRVKLVYFAVGLALAAAGAWRAVRHDRARARPLAIVVGLLLVLGAGHVVLVIGSIAHFSYVTRHYYAWIQIAWCLWFAYVAAAAIEALPVRWRAATVGAVAVVVIAAQTVAILPRFEPFSTKELRQGRMLAVAWAGANLPAGAAVGAWNAGQVGYFLDRPVVNLDGLVNDARYVDVLRGRRALLDYLRDEGIHYLMDYNSVDLSMPYHANWKRDERFRDAIDWRDLTVLHVQPAGSTAVHVLEVTPGRGAPPAATP